MSQPPAKATESLNPVENRQLLRTIFSPACNMTEIEITPEV